MEQRGSSAYASDRRGVLCGMAAAALATAFLWFLAWALAAGAEADRSRLLAQALLAPAVCLVAGIAFIARHRFDSEKAIGGANPPDDHVLERAGSYLQNTLEQSALAAMVYAALAIALPARWLVILPLMALAFASGRVAFAFGLEGRPPRRAFGFGLTFYPSVVGLAVAALLLLAGPG